MTAIKLIYDICFLVYKYTLLERNTVVVTGKKFILNLFAVIYACNGERAIIVTNMFYSDIILLAILLIDKALILY